MAWFIIQCERKTWTKYLVEAESQEAAMENNNNWKYLGYLDGEDTDSSIAGEAFESEAKALADTVSYVEG